ncbi:ead/Ea22-like family protein [Klebsiella pneumoniae]
MTDITELALIKGQKVEAPYYLAECTECGKMYSSSKLIVSRNYFDGDADCYCPHCNADDADIADLGSGEQPAVMAWNYQQARIDVLVEALEKAQQQTTESENRVRKQNRHICELFDDNTALRQRIAGLEARTVTVKQGEVLVTVAGFTGCGKSAIAGEIEIAMKAIGLPVTWANGDSEKRMTGADWLTAIEMYKPTVRIVEVNIPRAAGIKVEAE